MEKGETLSSALIRELKEEIGVNANKYAKLSEVEINASEGQDTVSFHLYTVELWDGQIVNLGDEHSELRWVNFQEAIDLPCLALSEYREVFKILRERDDLQ